MQHTISSVIAADPKVIVPVNILGASEGGAVFNISQVNDSSGKAINFGIEICLDHAFREGTE